MYNQCRIIVCSLILLSSSSFCLLTGRIPFPPTHPFSQREMFTDSSAEWYLNLIAGEEQSVLVVLSGVVVCMCAQAWVAKTFILLGCSYAMYLSYYSKHNKQ